MRRVEQHVIERAHPKFHAIDEMAFASKNLWNLANYYVRQAFIFQHSYLDNTAVNGSYNIGRKVFPTAFDGRGIEATAVRPRRLAV